jgi:molecular chaperone HtpG
MSDKVVTPESREFKAEVAAVLRLVTNSLYTNREIFLRELVSNASDALDKARFAALVDKDTLDQAVAPKITITIDRPRGVLVIEDTGIGMTHDEAAENLGTIAHSGTRRFLEQAAKDKPGEKADLDLIGQFGVGFYSAFMVADRIDVVTKSARPGHEAVHWSSAGDGGFTLGPADRDTRGTRIELHLKKDADEFLEPMRVESIVRRYSNFVLHPIDLVVIGDEARPSADARKINAAHAFWTRNPKEIGEDEYKEFYAHVMGGFVMPGDEPRARLHMSMDAPIQFRALLYVPGRRPADLFAEDTRALQLYARRVLVMESCDKLLPTYLRFMRGVVDSEDLPLNVSREMLQEHQSLSAIRRQLTRKVLKVLADTATEDEKRYAALWSDFGVFIKEGLHTDNAHRAEITELLRFGCSDRDGLVSLAQYRAAMKDDQPAIYYITGEHAVDLAKSPHLEACRAKGWPVLLMTDAVDEWVVQDLREYEGKPLRSVTQGELEPVEKAEEHDTAAEAGPLEALRAKAKTLLHDRVKDVRASKRLHTSAACLVDAEGGLPRNMERILRMTGGSLPTAPRILELNPEHPFVAAADALAQSGTDEGKLAQWVELLLDQAHLAEGTVPDPAGMVQRIQAVLDAVAGVADKGPS